MCNKKTHVIREIPNKMLLKFERQQRFNAQENTGRHRGRERFMFLPGSKKKRNFGGFWVLGYELIGPRGFQKQKVFIMIINKTGFFFPR